MRKVTPIPPGTVFGRLTVIEEARTKSGLPATRCRCECGEIVIVRNDSLRAGRTRSCGCLPRHKPLVLDRSLRRGEVPLGGKKARGRVALVDDEDYDLVMQYRWHLHESAQPGYRSGPYARGLVGGKLIFMHTLLTGHELTDHRDGSGLNNQRSNLRPATPAQNAVNRRKLAGAISRYTGVSRSARDAKWVARISYEHANRYLGSFASEEEAARAYDDAARDLYGEYARPNFPERSGAA